MHHTPLVLQIQQFDSKGRVTSTTHGYGGDNDFSRLNEIATALIGAMSMESDDAVFLMACNVIHASIENYGEPVSNAENGLTQAEVDAMKTIHAVRKARASRLLVSHE